MNKLFRDLGHIIANHSVTLAFDFDGTLSEFTEIPREAVVSSEMQKALAKAQEVANIIVISSRITPFIRERLKFIRNLQIYGLHGLETPTKNRSISLAEMISLVSLKHSVTAIIENERHARVEDKPAGFSVHFRGASMKEYENLSLMVRKAAHNAGFRAYGGNWALEILSNESPTKAGVLYKIAKNAGKNSALFYFGDDDADEEAFAKVHPFRKVVTVAIGRKNTAAKYALKDISELMLAINEISQKINSKHVKTR